MNESLFSKFTPSLMAPQALEAVFVQREKLAERLVNLVVDDAQSSGRHHSLMVGPRGIGKTFFISILYHRISQHTDLKDKIVIAWLKEEEWGVTSYAEFIISILRAMDTGKDQTFIDDMDLLYSLDGENVEEKAEALLESKASGRLILLLAENLDMIFEDIKEEGQRKLRAFLQETGFISIIATSQGLFEGVSRQTSPFYGSFHIHHFQCLTLDQSLELLEKIARLRQDDKLAKYIKTRAAKARIRAVIHLSGGNHRVMAIFSQFLTYDSLEDLVEPFMSMIDELTPYYQSKMKELPAQQRKIVDFLCGKRSAAQVKEIARKSFLTHQATSSQLKVLREKGYVVSKSIGRDSYYELAEPLMRLCVEVKMHRSGPVRLLVDMLRIWYSAGDLEKRIDFLKDKNRTIDFEYACKALELCKINPEDDPVYSICRDQFLTYLKNGDLAQAHDVFEDLVAARPEIREKIISDYPQYDEYDAIFTKGLACFKEKHYEEAADAFKQVCKFKPEKYVSWAMQGMALRELGRFEEAINAYNQACELKRDDPNIWIMKGRALVDVGRVGESIEALNQAFKLKPEDDKLLYVIGSSLFIEENFIELAGLPVDFSIPGMHRVGYLKGYGLAATGKWEEALCIIGGSLKLMDLKSDEEVIPSPNITSLLFDNYNHKQWQEKAEALVNIFRETKDLDFLAANVLQILEKVLSPMTSLPMAEEWLKVWEKAAGQDDEFIITLGIIRAGIKYKENADERVLMGLPVEERAVLRQVLEKSGFMTDQE